MLNFEIETVDCARTTNDVMGIRKDALVALIEVLQNCDAPSELIDLGRGEILAECRAWLMKLDKHGAYPVPKFSVLLKG